MQLPEQHILIIGGQQAERDQIQAYLFADKTKNLNVSLTDSANDALAFCKNSLPHCVILSPCLFDANADEFIEALRNDYPTLPIIIITDETNNISSKITQTVNATINREQFNKLDFLMTVEQVLENAELLQRLTQNQLNFNNQLQQRLSIAERYGYIVAVLLVEIENFERIQTGLSSQESSLLNDLIEQRLIATLRHNDAAFQIDDSCYAIILDEVAKHPDIALIIQRLLAVLEPAYAIEGINVQLDFNAGIACFPFDDKTIDALLVKARNALSNSKTMGAGHFQFYDQALQTTREQQVSLEENLQFALNNDGLKCDFQTIVNLHNQSIIGHQAQVIWQDNVLNLIKPSSFLPQSEQADILVKINEWLFSTSCQYYLKQLAENPDYRLFIPICARQLYDDSLLSMIDLLINNTAFPATQLVLEISEVHAVTHPQQTHHIIQCLKEIGIDICLTEFGKLYTHLNYLKDKPVDFIKIEEKLIHACQKKSHIKLLSAIINLAEIFDIAVIAPGIANQTQLQQLKALNCQYGQIINIDSSIK